MHNEVS